MLYGWGTLCVFPVVVFFNFIMCCNPNILCFSESVFWVYSASAVSSVAGLSVWFQPKRPYIFFDISDFEEHEFSCNYEIVPQTWGKIFLHSHLSFTAVYSLRLEKD